MFEIFNEICNFLVKIWEIISKFFPHVFGLDNSSTAAKRRRYRATRQNVNALYTKVSTAEELESTTSLSGDLIREDENRFRMHRPQLQDRFGTLRFRVEHDDKRSILLVTVIDAWDLPPMDMNGKADPYVEVSLRPGHKKYTTNIKPNCLNPTFNETAELPLKQEDIIEKQLVLKVMDSDYPLQDELIGIIRLPLSALDLTFSSRQYTCLILHEKQKDGNAKSLSNADAAKLNLKISQQAQDLYEAKIKLKEMEEKIEMWQEEYSVLKSEKIELEMECFRFEDEVCVQNQDRSFLSVDNTRSAPVSKGGSPTGGGRKAISQNGEENVEEEKSIFQLLSHLQTTLREKDKELANLRNHIRDLKPKLELMSSKNGQIDIGLSFYHVTSRLRIDILSAYNLRAVNVYGKDSDPFVKVKVYRHQLGGEVKRWKFSTSTLWKTLEPVWNEKFIVPDDICAEDLPHMHLEVVVFDKGRFRADQPLGKVIIGPNQTQDWHHWEEMIKQHGEIVKMTHAIKEV